MEKAGCAMYMEASRMNIPINACRLTQDPKCPYCGTEHADFWEVEGDSGDFDCHTCGRCFFYERHVDVTYNTSPKMGPHQQSEWDRQCEQEHLDEQRQRAR